MTLNYNSAAELKTFLNDNNLGMRKKFGQNFLINPNIRQSLVSALGAEAGDSVWEIGPGLGAMTSMLLENGMRVMAFEIDKGFIDILKKIFAGSPDFCLVEGDVIKTWQQAGAAPYLLGNLPYNIAATLLAGFIEHGRLFKRMVVTVQLEVARRMAASPGCADYSSFSVLCASAYRIKPLMVIKGASFYPKPNVDSQAVLLELKDDAAIQPACFYPLVRQLFSSRRKMIKNNFAGFFKCGNQAEAAAQVLDLCAIDGNKRAEDLSPSDFSLLAQTIKNMRIS